MFSARKGVKTSLDSHPVTETAERRWDLGFLLQYAEAIPDVVPSLLLKDTAWKSRWKTMGALSEGVMQSKVHGHRRWVQCLLLSPFSI